MKKLFVILSVFAICNSNAQTKKSFTISGKIDDIKSGTIYLNTYEEGNEKKDSAEIKDGAFAFKGTAIDGSTAIFDVKDGKQDYLRFYIENADLKVTGKGYPLSDWKISGSKLNDDNNALGKHMEPINNKFDAHYKLYDYADSIKNTAMMDSLDEAEFEMAKEKKNYVGAFVKANPNSLISAIAIKENFGYYTEASEVAPLYNVLTESIRQTETGKVVKNMLDVYETVAIGKTAPDITQEDTLGNKVSLSSLRGKYVMIDFWASWCGP